MFLYMQDKQIWKTYDMTLFFLYNFLASNNKTNLYICYVSWCVTVKWLCNANSPYIKQQIQSCLWRPRDPINWNNTVCVILNVNKYESACMFLTDICHFYSLLALSSSYVHADYPPCTWNYDNLNNIWNHPILHTLLGQTSFEDIHDPLNLC